jgi:alpha-glucosidase (family GH31 glycosyl hydrolase)
MICKILYYPLIFIIIAIGCTSLPEADYYSAEGVVSIEAETHQTSDNWVKSHYYTSMGMSSVKDTTGSGGTLDYRFYITEPGRYAIWVLSRKKSHQQNENYLEYALFNDENEEISRDRFQLPESNALVWLNRSHTDGQEIIADFSESGFYKIRFESFGEEGYRLDKMHLSLDNEIKPEGMGLPETTDPFADPAELKRNRPVAIPPAWTFGVLYGGYTNQDETVERVSKLYDDGYPIDAYWIDSWFWDYQNKGRGPAGYVDFIGDTAAYPDMKKMWSFMEDRNVKSGIWLWNTILQDGNENVYADFSDRGFFKETYLNTDRWHNQNGDSMTGDIDFENPEAAAYFKQKLKPFFENGLDFLKLDRVSDIPFTRTAFEAIREFSGIPDSRGFVLSHLHSTHDPRFLLYPAKWTGDAKIDWSQPDYPDFNRFAMGGLKENIEMAANPRLTTYEIPFLSHDMGGYNFFGAEGVSEELYIRWTQFAAFNTVMQVFTSPDNPTSNMPFEFSETAQDNFKKYTRLRSRLFPYIYTHAHLTRQTGRKMIQGDGIRTTQYRFGDSFLAAPVHEPDTDEWMVYLPEGNWFDYWTKDRFEGGQTWLIDASLTTLPLFVKAGAIIPYREFSQSVESGTNDFLTIEIYPYDGGVFRMTEDDGQTENYKEGEWARTMFRYNELSDHRIFTIGAVQGSFAEMNRERSYELHFMNSNRPDYITLNEEKIDESDSPGDRQWFYDSDSEKVILLLQNADRGEKIDIKIYN